MFLALRLSSLFAENMAQGSEANKPPIYQHFDFVQDGVHQASSKGGVVDVPCAWYRCKKGKDCRVRSGSGDELIKVVKKATSSLLKHLRACQGEEAWLRVRAESKGSKVAATSDGRLILKMAFKDLLPHHVRFVIYCFKSWKQFSATRSTEFCDYIRGFDERAGLPARETCIKILHVISHVIRRNLKELLTRMKEQQGSPCAGLIDDIWSKRRCRQSFACARVALGIDGDLLEAHCRALKTQAWSEKLSYSGSIVQCSPILNFSTLSSARHTGRVIADWKERVLADVGFTPKDISLNTADGASNNKKSVKLLKMPFMVCYPHNLQRAVLIAAGISGEPCRNPALRDYQKRSNRMASSFSRSGVATAALFESQSRDVTLARRKPLTVATPNATRWLGLYHQARRVRELQPHICQALCGKEGGVNDSDDSSSDDEAVGAPAYGEGSDSSDDPELGFDSQLSDDESSDNMSHDVLQQEAGVGGDADQGPFPLRNRLLKHSEFKQNTQWESCLVSAAEVSAALQAQDGLSLEKAYLLMHTLRHQMEAPRLQVVSGRFETESWEDISSARLTHMFKEFRSVMVEELSSRFFPGSPSEHVLLCFKLNPFLDSSASNPVLSSQTTQELLLSTYHTKLRMTYVHRRGLAQRGKTACEAAAVPAASAVPAPALASSSSAALASGSPAEAGIKKRQKIGELTATLHMTPKAPSTPGVADSAELEILQEIKKYSQIVGTLDVAKYAIDKTHEYDVNKFWYASCPCALPSCLVVHSTAHFTLCMTGARTSIGSPCTTIPT